MIKIKHRKVTLFPTTQTQTAKIFSLDANTAIGQLSDVKVTGRSLKNELNYTTSTYAEWTKSSGVVGDSTGLEFTANGAYPTASLSTSFKPSTKYGILLYVVSKTMLGTLYLTNNTVSDVFTGGTTIPAVIGNNKKVVTSLSTILHNSFSIYTDASETTGNKVKIKDIRIFELPSGSEIESDFNTYTADQLAQKYPYIKGGAPVSTLSGRLTSTKNLFKMPKSASAAWNGNTVNLSVSGTTLTITSTQPNNPVLVKINEALKACSTISAQSLVDKQIAPAGNYYINFTKTGTFDSIKIIGISGNTIKSVTAPTAFTASEPIAYIATYLNQPSNSMTISNLQLEVGNVATDYADYASGGQAYSSDLPTKWDSQNLTTGVYTQGGKNYTLQTSDIDIMYTGYSNVDIACTKYPMFGDAVIWNKDTMGAVIVNGMSEVAYSDMNNIASIGKFRAYDPTIGGQRIVFVVAKGTTLADAKTQLAGKTLSYQLATTVTKQYPIRIFENDQSALIIKCYGPNTTIIQDTVSIVEGKPASNQLTLPGTDALDSNTLKAYRNDGTVNNPKWVNVTSNCNLNTSTRVVTITNADTTKDYFIVVDVDPSGSTVGTISFKAPVNAIVTIPNRIEVGLK